ncbi:MAG: DsbA family protein [Pseudomonadota bacterium]
MASHFLKISVGAAAIFLSTSLTPLRAAEPLDSAQKQEVEAIIEQYLMENPDVLMRALQNVQAWQTAEQTRRQTDALVSVWDSVVTDSSIPSVGPVDAPVTVVEFFDYHCGYCKQAFNGLMDIADNSDNKVRTLFVEFPILSEESGVAAAAALAAAKQGKYIDIHRAFMDSRGLLDNARIDEIAADLGIDVAQMRTDMESQEILGALAQNNAMARAVGISGTPAFLIDGQLVSGADMDRVKALVQAGLENAS